MPARIGRASIMAHTDGHNVSRSGTRQTLRKRSNRRDRYTARHLTRIGEWDGMPSFYVPRDVARMARNA